MDTSFAQKLKGQSLNEISYVRRTSNPTGTSNTLRIPVIEKCACSSSARQSPRSLSTTSTLPPHWDCRRSTASACTRRSNRCRLNSRSHDRRATLRLCRATLCRATLGRASLRRATLRRANLRTRTRNRRSHNPTRTLHIRNAFLLQRSWQKWLNQLLPYSGIESRTSVHSQATGLKTTPLLPISAARRVASPERTSCPGSPADVHIVIRHIINHIGEIGSTLSGICCTKLSDHCFEAVHFEPGCYASEIACCGLGADGVTTREVGVEIFVDVKCCGC